MKQKYVRSPEENHLDELQKRFQTGELSFDSLSPDDKANLDTAIALAVRRLCQEKAVRQLLTSADLLEDVLSCVYLASYSHLTTGPNKGALRLSSWLSSGKPLYCILRTFIMRNIALDQLRRTSRHPNCIPLYSVIENCVIIDGEIYPSAENEYFNNPFDDYYTSTARASALADIVINSAKNALQVLIVLDTIMCSFSAKQLSMEIITSSADVNEMIKIRLAKVMAEYDLTGINEKNYCDKYIQKLKNLPYPAVRKRVDQQASLVRGFMARAAELSGYLTGTDSHSTNSRTCRK